MCCSQNNFEYVWFVKYTRKKINSNQMEFIYFDYDFQTVNLACQKLSQMMKFFTQGILFEIVSICVLHIRNIKCILHCHQLNPMSKNFLSSMHSFMHLTNGMVKYWFKMLSIFLSRWFLFSSFSFLIFELKMTFIFENELSFLVEKCFVLVSFSHLLQKLK